MLRTLATLAALLFACAALAQAPAPAAESNDPEPKGPEPKSLEEIFTCLAAGLTQDWRSATVEVIEISSSGKERQFEARHTFTRAGDPKPQRLQPCDDTSAAKGVHGFNQFLDPEKREWKRAILIFNSDGKFDLKYDYAP